MRNYVSNEFIYDWVHLLFSSTELFEQTGQYEPITTRIRNILREYKDGIGIFKELIQNADDAGATTVKFLVDWRKGQTGSLFSPGMAECQGPALWAYNNAKFSDEDFENINKLAGEAKVKDISKIGQFGLGFNAVYHLTDVPSFISRKRFVVFDPNTHHLQHHIKDRSRPGIRIDFAEKPNSLTRYHDQFQPYNGVFGCNTVQRRRRFYYNGTLFRFPFRTAIQARTSDISKTAYSKDRIKAIVSDLCECASTLLIFSQHIKEVELYELDRSEQPEHLHLVLSVNKYKKMSEPFIKQCSKWFEHYLQYQVSSTDYPLCSDLVNISVKKNPSELIPRERRHNADVTWLVISASGNDASLELARRKEGRARGFLPAAGVAFIVKKALEKRLQTMPVSSSFQASNDGSQKSTLASNLCGELFCFLPLSIPTGLPVHVNGNFAIMSNRVEIWKRTTMQSQPIEVIWNEALMEDALARAYIVLLESMKELIGKVQDYEFHTLWPNRDVADMQSWEKLVKKVCTVLLDTQSELFYSDGKWMSITDGYLLSDDFNEIHVTTVEVLKSLGIHVFDLPYHILQTLKKFDRQRILHRRTLTFTEFMKQHFFPNVKILTPQQRDTIVCFGLDCIWKGSKALLPTCTELSYLFKQNACIAVSENRKILAKPSELIHPFSDAAKLFSKNDHRFPVGYTLCSADRLHVLEKLGMAKDLGWTGILERARSIADEHFPEAVRSQKLIEYLNKRIDQIPKSSCDRLDLRFIKFLPVLEKPMDEYFLPWKGSRCFRAAKDVFLPKDAKLVGSSCLILNTSKTNGCGKLNEKVKTLLGFTSSLPDNKFVIQQLDEVIKFWKKLPKEENQNLKKRSAIESVCRKIYRFFNDQIVEKIKNQSSLDELTKRHWLFLEGQFVQSRKVAYTANRNGAPYLFVLPADYKRDYRHLFEEMQIKHTFDDEDFIGALYDLSSVKQGRVLTEQELQLATYLITQINVQNPTVKAKTGNIPLPDSGSVLRPSRNVVVNLDLWLEDRDNNLKVHEKIPPQTAHALGARSLKSVILKKCAHRIGYGESFGQHEDLTDRLKGILDGYPTDGILKELVQNADDAGASEIHFIHDTRSLGNKKVATDEASEEIQGPALCVYNNKPFTKKDLDGIKRLGIGSKRCSPELTGIYGIGFNSVYHLTDCPSFLSNYDTLAFLDPHCRYFVDDDRGRLFKLKSVNQEFLNNISDTLEGYLPKHFNLQGSTMFRFPLRRKRNESKISNISPDMEKLMKTLQEESRKSLLFLNHIKVITLWKMYPNNVLKEVYRVETVMTAEDEKKRQDMTRKICRLSDTPTSEIAWEGANYTLTVRENRKTVEMWLIQKCIGSIFTKNLDEIPDGRKLGLLPRGGLAARLMCSSSSKKQSVLDGMVYCFLPLPQNYTNLPVHVNGSFALDTSRRGLWTETDGQGPKCKWNHFMNTCVLPPAYVSLIKEARNHLCRDRNDKKLSHYHALFPNVLSDSPWRALTIELYRCLGQERAKVLPLLVPVPKKDMSVSSMKKCPVTSQLEKVKCTTWLSVDQSYFKSRRPETSSNENDDLLALLLRIGLPVLLYAPRRIQIGFKSASITFHEVTPANVIDFLRRSTCKITNLPKKLETTAVQSVKELVALIKYCCEDEDFGKQLEGLPLLLTQDGYIRAFDSSQRVFCSKFGNLFPSQLQFFVHSKIFHQISEIAYKSEENIIWELTVNDIEMLLHHVFTDKDLRAIKDEATWKYPVEGTLSEQWFKDLWDCLQNCAKPGKPLPLEYLSEWPVIPTKCGKLMTIREAKFVFDMTTTGTESSAQVKVRTFLSNIECPVLNKEITLNEKHSSFKWGAITDPYVAHPHKVRDVLIVLRQMLKTSKLDLSKVHEDEIRHLLQYVQDNYERSERSEQCKEIVKSLPFHKSLNGQFVGLTTLHSSYALVPSDVPTQQLHELQKRAKCLFLDSDALPSLEKLYRDLGVIAGQNVTQFYVCYVIKYFSMFTRENQIKHLVYIRDKVHPSFPQGASAEKDTFLKCMAQTPCIPDENGYLHPPIEFFDQNNSVFKAMYAGDNSKFPPPPFNEESWSNLLQDIGLQNQITPELFLQFCTTVAENGKHYPGNRPYRVQSEELVNCLFTKKLLQEEKFVSRISQIKFIAPAELEEEFASIHQQYQCSRNGHPPFIKLSGSVPWSFRNLAWTSASILPDWAQPNNDAKLKNVNISWCGPKYTDVLDHLKNIAASYNSDKVDSNLINGITKAVYQYLCKFIQCYRHRSNSKCSEVCMYIGAQLKDVPCIFLQENEAFVKGEQLVFKLPENCDFKPFLYPVPREFGELQHFLKQLGATEKPTPLQISFVLKSLHQEVGHKALSSELESKVKYAMHIIFELLSKGESADGIEKLYLPGNYIYQDKKIFRSCKMVCQVSSRFTKVIENLESPILLPFEECGLKKVADIYIDSLPKHLRPTKFDELIREEVDPKHKISICPQAQRGSLCSFQEQILNLLKSDEFQEGLKRLLIEDRQDPKEFKQRIQKLQSEVHTKCIGHGNIKINIVRRDTDEVVYNLTTSCYAVHEKRTWSLYIQHEFKADRGLVSAATCVNNILGDCIVKEKGLIAMLACDSPNEISGELDKLGITRSTSKVADEFPDFNDEILELDDGNESGSGLIDSQNCESSHDMSGPANSHTGAHSVGYRGGFGHSR